MAGNLSMMEGWLSNPFLGTGISLLIVWGLVWKGLALWRAARENSPWWFVALLLLQTWGVVEIIYLFFFAKEKIMLTNSTSKKSTSRPKSRKS